MRQVYPAAYSQQAPPSLPPGLLEAMEGLTRAVLQNDPPDIYLFCAEHFDKLLEIRDVKEDKKRKPRKLTLEEKIKRAQDFMRAKAADRRRFLENQNNMLLNNEIEHNGKIITGNVETSSEKQFDEHKEMENVESSVSTDKIPNLANVLSLPSPSMSPPNENEQESNKNADVKVSELKEDAQLECVLAESLKTDNHHTSKADEHENMGTQITVVSEELKKEANTYMSGLNVFDDSVHQEEIEDMQNFHENFDQSLKDDDALIISMESKTADVIKDPEITTKQTDDEQIDVITEDPFNATTNVINEQETLPKADDNIAPIDNEDDNKEEKSEYISEVIVEIAAEEKVNLGDILNSTEPNNAKHEDIACINKNASDKDNTPNVNVDDIKHPAAVLFREPIQDIASVAKDQKLVFAEENLSGEMNDTLIKVEECVLVTDKERSKNDTQGTLTAVSKTYPNNEIINADKEGNEIDIAELEKEDKFQLQDHINIHSNDAKMVAEEKEHKETKSTPDIVDSKIMLQNVESEILNSVKIDANDFKHDSVDKDKDQYVTSNEIPTDLNTEYSGADTGSVPTEEVVKPIAYLNTNVSNNYNNNFQKNYQSENEINEESTTTEEDRNTDKNKLTNQTESMDLETAAITIQKVFREFMFKSNTSTSEDNINGNSLEMASGDIFDATSNSEVDASNKNIEEATVDAGKVVGTLARMNTVLQTVNEEKSLSLSTDESLSSSATIIQAHVRGFLIRNKLKLTSTDTPANSEELATVEGDYVKIPTKTVLNINIPEQDNLINADESIDISVDLPTDPVNYVANLHPLGYDRNEARKRLKREDAVQSVSPPSNSSIKLSEESLKEATVIDTENKISTETENSELREDKGKFSAGDDTANDQMKESFSGKNNDFSVSEDSKKVNIQTEVSEQISNSEKFVTKDLVTDEIENRENSTDDTKSNNEETRLEEQPKNNRSSSEDKNMSSDEMDVVTGPGLLHSSEFHDVMLPTQVMRKDTSVVREFKSVLVYFLKWHSS